MGEGGISIKFFLILAQLFAVYSMASGAPTVRSLAQADAKEREMKDVIVVIGAGLIPLCADWPSGVSAALVTKDVFAKP